VFYLPEEGSIRVVLLQKLRSRTISKKMIVRSCTGSSECLNMLPSNGSMRIPHVVPPYVSSLWRQRLEDSTVSKGVGIASSAQCKFRFDSCTGNMFVSFPECPNRLWVPCIGTRDSFRVGKSAGAYSSLLIPVYI